MIFKKVIPTLLLFLTCFFQKTNSQSFIALSSGISKDLKNPKPFYHIPISLRWEAFKRSGFFIAANYGIPFSRNSFADAYTINPLLPGHVMLKEKIQPHLFSIELGGTIHLYTNKKNNSMYLDIATGVSAQHFKVNYVNYDRINYEVLNPDVNTDSSGLILSIAYIYTFHRRKQDMFLMLHIQTPPLLSALNYYAMTYKVMAPLQLTFGYKLIYNKRK